MIFFMIKKAFFDMWDNFLPIVLINLGFILVAALPIVLPPAVYPLHPAFGFIALFAGIIVFFLYTGTVSMITADIADYKKPEMKDVPKYFKETWKSSLVLGVIMSFLGFILSIAFPVYLNMGNMIGLLALVFLFWATVIWLLSSMYYFPIRARLDTRIPKIIKKCFILFFDNTLFSLALAITVLAAFILSALTAFLLPGIGTILLLLQVAAKLRIYKYDYLEENPEANRRKIPWDALLIDDKQRVGKRTLRGMIFPWKE